MAGFIKSNVTNGQNYVLTADGGHKALSDFAMSTALSGYLPLSGGTMTGAIDFNGYAKNSIDTTNAFASFQPSDSSHRASGVYGVYDSTRLGHVWSMGTDYRISNDGSDPNTLYGLAYFHTNWSNSTTYNTNAANKTAIGTYAGGHQVGWFQNGVISASIGSYIWTRNGFLKNGSSNSYVLLGGGGHKAVSDFAAASSIPTKTSQLTNDSGFLTSHQSLANYVTLNGDQTITGAKTFNGTKFILAGNESNEIQNIHYSNGLYYKYDDSAALGGSISIRNALRFRWYNDYWVIGNIKSGNTVTYGFGIALLNSDGTHQLDRFMVSKDGAGFLNGQQIATQTWVNNSFAKIASHNNLMANENEFTFASSGYSGSIYINYRTAGGTNGNITEYILGNGKAGRLGTIIHSGNISSYALTSLRIADAQGAGGAPITTSVNNSAVTNSYYILATTSSGSCGWYQLPSTAFSDNNTTYSAGTGLTKDGNTFKALVATNTQLGVTKYVKYYSAASVKRYNGDVGGSEVDTSTTANIELAYASSTSGRFYPVQVDKNGFPFVNIPWSDTNTTYTFTTSGSGNVLTGVSTSGTTITFTKGNVSSGSTYGVVSNSENGLAPKVISTNTASIGSAYYVLASTNGSASPSWYKLPSTAFSDSNSWRTVQINGTSIGNNTLNIKSGGGISVGNSSGTATISLYISVNGSTAGDSTSIYAPTTAGTSGYILQSNGSGAPGWTSFTSISSIVKIQSSVPSSFNSNTLYVITG